MTVTQYIGSRYVPIFANPIDWDSTREYEPLTIVSNKGNSYTSRQAVPKGIDISDEKYWALTGNYNSQVESYRQETKNYVAQVGEYKQQVTDAVNKVDADLAQQKKDVSAQLESQNAKITSQLATQDSKITSQLATQDSKITSQLATQDSKVTKQLADNKLYVDTEVGKVSKYRQAIIDTDAQLDLQTISFTTLPITIAHSGSSSEPVKRWVTMPLYSFMGRQFLVYKIPTWLEAMLPYKMKFRVYINIASGEGNDSIQDIMEAIPNFVVYTTNDTETHTYPYINMTLQPKQPGEDYYILSYGNSDANNNFVSFENISGKDIVIQGYGFLQCAQGLDYYYKFSEDI